MVWRAMSVMSALVIAVLIGLAAAWNKTVTIISLLEEFQKVVISIAGQKYLLF